MSGSCIYSWQKCFSKIHRQFLHSENSAKITGIITIGPVDRNHIQRTTYPSLSLVYRQVLQPYPSASSQETVTPTEHPASTRSESMSEDVQGNLPHGPAETENPNKNDDNEEVRGNLSHDLPEVQARSARWKCSITQRRFQFFSWITFRAASKSGIG